MLISSNETDDEEENLPFTAVATKTLSNSDGAVRIEYDENQSNLRLCEPDIEEPKRKLRFNKLSLSRSISTKENLLCKPYREEENSLFSKIYNNHELTKTLSLKNIINNKNNNNNNILTENIVKDIKDKSPPSIYTRKRRFFTTSHSDRLKVNYRSLSVQPLIKNSKISTTIRPSCEPVKRKIIDTEDNLFSKSASILGKKPKIIKQITTSTPINTNMSVYERRVSSDDRPIIGNGFISSKNTHNDDNSNALTNHYYSYSQPTMATLCNIGNTCYLNSVVYTLRFAPKFLHNLHHLIDDLTNVQRNIGKYRAKSSSLGRNVSGIHMENARSWSSKDLASLENSSCDIPKSNQQFATEKLHELYQHLHRNEMNEMSEVTEPFQADQFLHAIQEVSAIFEGNQQQDAHEFLMCVLDSIRETCQSLIKAVLECPDMISNGFVSLPEQQEVQPVKEPPPQRESTGAAIIKTAFFSRKSKRKDESKNSKNIRLQSPHKDNTQLFTGDAIDGVIGNDKNNSAKTGTNLDDDVFNKDKERISEKIKKLGLDFFTEDFEGITVSTTKCLSCETITEQKETMIDIAVPISDYGNTEKEDTFIQNSCITREYFRGDNKYRCEQCIGYTEAIRSISYEVLPRLLVIQLSRFSGGMEKISSYLPTPFELQCFCAKCCKQDEKLHIYKLYSVITHVGPTISVGHYIAYTCSLDWANDYVNCPKDRKRQTHIITSRGSIGSANTNSVNNVKKKLFSRNKASSSGDMSKQVKNINGISSKSLTNGGGEKAMANSSTCQSINCCGIRLKNNYSSCVNSNNYNNGSCNNTNNGAYIDFDDNQGSHPYNTNSAGYNNYTMAGSNNRSKLQNSNNEPLWYMCDDDKIKVMSQREFQELLSPNRKIMITPYLLFYARSNLQ